MTNKLEIHGLDLTAIGIGDCGSSLCSDDMFHRYAERIAEQQLRLLLGSITFGPVIPITNDEFNSLLYNPEDIDDDENWEYAE